MTRFRISLIEKNPQRAKLWHPYKNGDFTPENVSYGSDKSVWWRCSDGHEWVAPINRKGGCPKCKETYQTSFPELTLRFMIKSVFSDAVATFTHENFGKFKTVDLYIPSLNLIIEHDGYFYHKDHIERDLEKSKVLLTAGYRLLRVRQNSQQDLPLMKLEGLLTHSYTYSVNEEKLKQSMLEVLELIKHTFILAPEQTLAIQYLKQAPFRNLRMPILDQVIPIIKKNHILLKKPHLEQEWNYARNLSYKPIHFSAAANFKVWWKCENGHEWDAVVGSRTKEKDVGCPFCAGLFPTPETCLSCSS